MTTNNISSQQLLRVDEVAGKLNVTPSCIRRWILERRIASVRVGRLVRITPETVEKIIEAGIVPARPQRGGRHGK